ncbi:copper resistance protein CopC [Streptomyces sp. NPDC057638]|uniref:copper resistance protein CopC n=1 Tax=Streptomyces sp. NPDC057638 TaxID=3346190 RepID=UPI003676A220
MTTTLTTTSAAARGALTGRPLPRAARWPLTAVLLMVAALGTLLATAGPAAAHATLTGSDPADGAVVATAPQRVTLTFSEPMSMGKDSIRVLEPSGERADAATVSDLSRTGTASYAVGLLPGLPDGTYTVAWKAISADSHPIAGAFTFSIGAPSATTVSVGDGTQGGGAVGVLYDVARYAAYAGYALMVGAAAFILLCWPRGASVRPVQRLVVHGWLALTAATLAALMLRVPYTGSGRLGDVFDLVGLQDVLATRTGAALVSRLLLLGAAALFIAVLFGAYVRRDSPGQHGVDEGQEARGGRKDLTVGLSVGGGLVVTGIAATWALSEHASTGLQPQIAIPVDIVHLLAVAVWLGGLVALLTALHRAPSIEPEAVRRFSRAAFVSVVVLALTGLYQSWRQVGSWSALTGTEYGKLLLAKVGLVVVMVAVAWFSRRWTARLPRTATGPAGDTEDPAEPAGTAESGAGPGGRPDAGGSATTGPGEPASQEARPPNASPQEADSVPAQEPVQEPAQQPAPDSAPLSGGTADPSRVAQLARQRAAVATARRKKARDADPVRSGLRRSVLIEATVAIVLLAVTTTLTTTEPARTQQEAGPAAVGGAPRAPQGPVELSLPFDTGGDNGKGTVRLTLGPAAPGGNELHVWATRPDGTPLDAPELRLALTLEDKAIGPLPITPDRLAPGHWTKASVQIPMPGSWLLQVTVRTSEIDQTTIDTTVRIG